MTSKAKHRRRWCLKSFFYPALLVNTWLAHSSVLTVTNFVLKRYKNLYIGERDREKKHDFSVNNATLSNAIVFAMVGERWKSHERSSRNPFPIQSFSDLICNSEVTIITFGGVFEHLCSFLKSLLKKQPKHIKVSSNWKMVDKTKRKCHDPWGDFCFFEKCCKCFVCFIVEQ